MTEIIGPLHTRQRQTWPYDSELVSANGVVVASLAWDALVTAQSPEEALTPVNRARALAVDRAIFSEATARLLRAELEDLVAKVSALGIGEEALSSARARLEATASLQAHGGNRFAIVERQTRTGVTEFIVGFTRGGRQGGRLWTTSLDMAYVFDLGDDAQRLHFNEIILECEGAKRRSVKEEEL